MPKKAKEVPEMEVDVTPSAKPKETYVTHWFRDHVVNNEREMRMACELTARAAENQFCIQSRSGNMEVYGIIFYATFMCILDFLRTKQKTFKEFTMEICNSVNLGYVNNVDENNEKVGNFMPVMEYIGINRRLVDVDHNSDNENQTSENCIQWKRLNTKKNGEYFAEIQEAAYEKLRTEFHVDLRTSEMVIPLFCIFLDHITAIAKIMYQEAMGTDVSEVSMNCFGLFDIFYSYNEEDGKEIYEYQPNITMKLALKSDDIAFTN